MVITAAHICLHIINGEFFTHLMSSPLLCMLLYPIAAVATRSWA